MPNWTQEQKNVLESRDRNLLVSAAAGSGKTTVLVQRLIDMLTEPGSTLDIDRLLVVTFTEAAASDMKDKILKALEKTLEERPDDGHLAKQLTLIHSAQISTIHSFCLSVIRSHFQEIDLDPSFRTADEGELKLLKKDVSDALLEDCFASIGIDGEHPAFLGEDCSFEACVQALETGKSLGRIRQHVENLFDYSRSYPDPEEWLLKCRALYEKDYGSDGELTWLNELEKQIRQKAHGWVQAEELLIQLNREKNGPFKYDTFLQEDMERLRTLEERLKAATLKDMGEILQQAALPNMVTIRGTGDWSEETKETVRVRRNKVKEAVTKLGSEYFSSTWEDMQKELEISGNTVRVLIDLTLEFGRRFAAVKKKKNLIDYGDMEHFALQILSEKREGELVPSPAAKTYMDYFTEVIMDEYQDSSYLQEALMRMVSGVFAGRNNRFMVGDVKQSIYSFRQSRPEIFMEKYRDYNRPEVKESHRIDLTRNFRSGSWVLDSVNAIFRHIMRREVGGVDYTTEQELVCGREEHASEEQKKQIPADREKNKTEILLLDHTKDTTAEETEDGVKELEFRMIAHRILDMVGKETVKDPKTGEERLVRYGDIVILLRTVKNWAETGVRILSEYNIPVYAESKSGYYNAIEVQTILNYLRILDNPCQDIPMAAVLHSPMGDFSSEEMAEIRSRYPAGDFSFAEAVQQLAAEGSNEKLTRFMNQVEKHREAVLYTPLHRLIRQILEETGYGVYLRAMRDGVRRQANMEMLIQKASDFEQISYKGIFHFLRYLDQLKEREVDQGEANVSAGLDSVQIFSDHKSKGLEYPVVFVSGLGKSLGGGRGENSIVVHPHYGIAADSYDVEYRTLTPTLHKRMILNAGKQEEIGEEIRILYVALTRAREKLILTGAVKDADKCHEKWQSSAWDGPFLGVSQILAAGNSLDLVMPAVYKEPEFFEVCTLSLGDMDDADIREQAAKLLERDAVSMVDTTQSYLPKLKEALCRNASYRYPHEASLGYVAKVSVSDLKMKHMEEEFEGNSPFQEELPSPMVPAFLSDTEKETGGAYRGTAYHRYLELFDYNATKEMTLPIGKEEVVRQLEQMVGKGTLPEDQGQLIPAEQMVRFLSDPLALRMREASLRGELFREQQFMLGIDGRMIYDHAEPEDIYLVQGIIDAYFREEDSLILVDYKTDRVPDAESLRKRYSTQLEYYARALEQLCCLRVTEIYMYSFALHKAVPVYRTESGDPVLWKE